MYVRCVFVMCAVANMGRAGWRRSEEKELIGQGGSDGEESERRRGVIVKEV